MKIALLIGFAVSHLLMISSYIRHIDFKTKDYRTLGAGLMSSILSFMVSISLIILISYPEKRSFSDWLEVVFLANCVLL